MSSIIEITRKFRSIKELVRILPFDQFKVNPVLQDFLKLCFVQAEDPAINTTQIMRHRLITEQISLIG
jgi:hypothetical protein